MIDCVPWGILHKSVKIKTTGLKTSPLEVHGLHILIADGTRGPALVTQGQVVEHAGPTEDVSTASDVSRHRRVQADGAGGHLMAVDALWTQHNPMHPIIRLCWESMCSD